MVHSDEREFDGRSFFGNGILRAARLASPSEQRSAPRARGQQGSKKNDGIEAAAAFARPVNVAQVQPERELVESQRRADAVKNGHQPAGKDRGTARAVADLAQPAIPDHEQNDDSENQVMNVPASHLDEVKGWNIVQNAVNHGANPGKSQEETDRRDEQTTAGTIGNAVMQRFAERSSVQNQQADYRARNRQQQNEPGVSHAALNRRIGYARQSPLSTGIFRPRAGSSSGDAPTTTAPDTAAHSSRSPR